MSKFKSIEAEQTLLGLCLIDEDVALQATGKLKEDIFTEPSHRVIFEAVQELVSEDRYIDPVTVANYLDDVDLLDRANGQFYIESLEEDLEKKKSADEYIDILLNKYNLRQAKITLNDAIEQLHRSEADAKQIFDRVQGNLLSVGFDKDRQIIQVRERTEDVIEEVERRRELEDCVVGVPTGFTQLDELTGGWQPGELIYWAARTGMGKSRSILNAALNAAHQGYGVSIHSLEMMTDELILDLLSIESGVSADNARKGFVNDEDIEKLNESRNIIDNLPLFINDSTDITVAEVRSEVEQLRQQGHEIDWEIIDYMQLMNASGSHRTREQEIAEISRNLKKSAKTLGIPVTALSQLNRSPDNRGGECRPQLSDLRESGSQEMDANAVVFVYRAEYYGLDEFSSGPLQGLSTENITEFIIGKQRSGPPGTAYMRWDKDSLKFEDFHYQENQTYEPEQPEEELPF